MRYWEIVADKLSAAGWSWGYCSAVTRDGWRWIVDAHREGRRYVRRSKTGQFKKEVNVGRSLAADRRRKAKTIAAKGQGDRGDT